jgi:ABC-2 type transport system ATP-binding protein/lipopolysaccharide transport system ATP-binding protein
MLNRIEVVGVSKRYRLGERADVRDTVAALVRRRRLAERKDVWSLRDVSFEVPDGGALGIVGRNGAGKSTILKVLMRITTPTEGVARTRGRVAALLEVGTGFHAELTGRENVFLNAAVLGMTRADTAKRFDEIVAFAGTEQFLDTPVKRYSSGMYLRLAFAVAAHLEPDVLIVDEVLAVGDAEFQRRCMGRMTDAEREGRTVVFVSHDLDSLTKLCARSLWLEGGVVRDDGPTARIVRDYLQSGFAGSRQDARQFAHGDGVGLLDVQVRPVDGDPRLPLVRDEPFQIVVDLLVDEPRPGLDVAVFVTTTRGTRVFDEALSDRSDAGLPAGRHGWSWTCPPS